MNVQIMLSVMIVIHLSSYLSIHIMSCHSVHQKTISLYIYLYSIKKEKKTWTVISILFKIRLLNQFTLWCDMHTYTKSCKLYEKGLGEFTDFISIRITFMSSTCKWFVIQVPVSIDLVMTVGLIHVLLSVHHMLA